MPLSQLDPAIALIVIDMQKGIVALPTVHPIAGVTDNIAQLCRAFRKHGRPVILVNVTGRAPGRVEASFNFTPPADWAELIPELEHQPSDYIVTKENISAFYGTALERILRRQGVTQIFLTGVATGSGVEATARQAYDQGFNVVAITDAMTDLDPDMHRHAVEKVFPKIGERTLTAEVLGQLDPK
ncbi:MAG TPA: isochorismatase family cysteine hydrolase [Rhizomicrobium sp.]|jgi:nicotinamidase-related amidase|nr:isochorismatase family cysteine hydrolase [Rhizomicrobium sp.]